MIPGRFLLYFEPTMKKPIWHSRSVNANTIFDWLRSRKRRFICVERIPPFQDDFAAVRRFEQLSSRLKPSFAWVKLNLLDTAGHIYGPDISLLQRNLKQIDSLVQELVEWGQKVGLSDVLLMSDHGMSFVEQWHDPNSFLNKIQDALFFVDSTMVRFWFRKESQVDKVVNVIESLPYGKILTSEEMTKLKAPIDANYGEIVFALDEGHVFHPDFWSDGKKVKGMHGYAYPKSTSAYPFLLSNHEMASFASSDNKNFFEFTDIMPWVIRKLENEAT
jgi:predicted AlkP superfamily pyrophosphatase or phosphodiesterase